MNKEVSQGKGKAESFVLIKFKSYVNFKREATVIDKGKCNDLKDSAQLVNATEEPKTFKGGVL